MYEVTVTATVTTKVNDKVLFLVEAKQAGIFEIRNIPEEQLQPIIGIACPSIIYPYLRAIVSDVCTRAGFPPVRAAEVNFQAMYEAQQAQAAARRRQRLGSSQRLTDARGAEPARQRARRAPGGRASDEHHRARRRRLGHGAGGAGLRAAPDVGCGRATPARRRRCARCGATRATWPSVVLPPALQVTRRPRRRAGARRATA